MADNTASLSLLGTLSGAYAQYRQGQARRRISKANERIAELQARVAKREGRAQEAKSRQAYKKLLGKQRTALAAQGIDLGGETSRQLQQETKVMSELDALTIRLNAARRSFGLEQEARGYGVEGKMAEAESKTAALSTILSGGLRAYEQYQRK